MPKDQKIILENYQIPYLMSNPICSSVPSLIHMTSSLVWQYQCIKQIIHKSLTIIFLAHMILGLSS